MNPTTASPTLSPSASPSRNLFQVDVTGRLFIAYVSNSTVEPTAAQYEALADATQAYYIIFLNMTFAADPLIEFIGFEMKLASSLFDGGIPRPRFNHYTEYSITKASFTRASRNNPNSAELFAILMSGLTSDYVVKVVDPINGMPFGQVSEVFMSKI
jgi:hypothetical protein